MPTLGELKKTKGRNKLIWATCTDCGKERWVVCRDNEALYTRCITCANNSKNRNQTKQNNPNWKGGRTLSKKGYVLVLLDKDDPFVSMTNHGGYVLEHRLVMARKLNRCLARSERVHHLDGIPSHNDESNLELISTANHYLYNTLCGKCKLRKEVRLLRKQVENLTNQIGGKFFENIACTT